MSEQPPYPPVRIQVGHHGFGMVVNLILGHTWPRERMDIGIVPIYQHPNFLIHDEFGEQLGWPEDARGLTRPCVLRIATQAMHQDQIDQGRTGWSRRVDFGQAEAEYWAESST